ncbi:MAG TPA: hypothetical protein PL041_03430 [Melioribacteraceae bacterium]|nr:hypothetical protein [Melioribacteraceae bacterium]
MTKNLPKEVANYLNKFEYKKYNLYYPINKVYNVIIVIPVIAEFKNISKLIESFNNNNSSFFNSTLILFVINNLPNAEEKIKKDNLNTAKYIQDIILTDDNKININLIDAFSSGNELPEKDGGVGLARKIGMDIALKYFDYSQNTLLVCLDSDCEISSNYLEVLDYSRKQGVDAGYIPFIHRFTDYEEENFAIICYDIFLHYYVAFLKYAESPYAFHTIGSTMVCSANAYCKIQGMNKRLAAEDFYFMEKLSKVYEIKVLKEATVYPLGRSSWRVPFGTGQRVARYLLHLQDEYILYNPEIFLILKQWNLFFFDKNILSADAYLKRALNINGKLHDFLELNKFEEAWNKIILSSQNELQIFKQKKYWFDGFRTLKLVHYLRDNGFNNVKMKDALNIFNRLIGVKINNSFITKEEQIKYLTVLKDYITN